MNWRDAVFSANHDNILYVGGKEGVWKSLNQGKSFQPLNAGFPSAVYERDTLSLLLAINQEQETLYTGTKSSLFYQLNESWQRVDHPALRDQAVVDHLHFAMPDEIRSQSRISLWNTLFELHNGRIFEQFIGPSYWLIIPLGGILLLIITLSGTINWLRRHRRKALRQKITR